MEGHSASVVDMAFQGAFVLWLVRGGWLSHSELAGPLDVVYSTQMTSKPRASVSTDGKSE